MSRSLFGDRTRLVLLSFVMLFVELALLRWTGSDVISLSYFSNFVLLGSFLGIGLGILFVETLAAGTSWSPYYKIETKPSQTVAGALLVNVNGLPHQAYFPPSGPRATPTRSTTSRTTASRTRRSTRCS